MGFFDPITPPASWMARLAITSLAFMLDWVPDPVWNTTSGNSSSSLPSITSWAARTMRSTLSLGNCLSSRLASAAHFFKRPKARTTGRLQRCRSIPMTKFWRERSVWAPHGCSAGTRTSPSASFSTRHLSLSADPSVIVPFSGVAQAKARRLAPIAPLLYKPAPRADIRHPWRQGATDIKDIIMAAIKQLAAVARSGTGKGAARSVRREGRIPAVIYGGGVKPEPISVDFKEVNKFIYAGHFLTSIFELELDGRKERVLPRDYQLDVVADRPVHVDFLRLSPGSRVRIGVPVHVVNREASPGLKKGGAVNLVLHNVEVMAPADAIPESITIDLTGLDFHDSVHVSAIKLPEGCRPVSARADFTVVTIVPPTVMAEETPAAAATTAAAPAAPGTPGAAAAPAPGAPAKAEAGKAAAPAAGTPAKAETGKGKK